MHHSICSQLGVGVIGLAMALGGSACSGEKDRAPGLSGCEGVLCGAQGGGESTPGDAGSDGVMQGDALPDAEPILVQLSGNVVRFVDQDFSQSQPYAGWGYLRVPTPSGDDEVPFGGDAGAGYLAEGVVAGDGWFAVVPDAALLDTGIMPTYAYLHVSETPTPGFAIPIIDRATLSTIYSGFVQPVTVRGDAAQVIVIFERGGQRVAGVAITAHPSAEVVAFNTGVSYTTNASETGANGVALLANVTGTGPMEWQEQGGEVSSLSIVQVPGQASLVRIDLPEE